MFVYQNEDGHICVTFEANKPVKEPEYIIAVDDIAKKLYMVSGSIEDMPEQDEEVVKETIVVETPKVEELDDVVENDTMQELEFAPVTEAINGGAPALDDIREPIEGEAEDANEAAPVTKADNLGAPSVEELDDVAENDPPVVEETVEDDEPATEEDVEA